MHACAHILRRKLSGGPRARVAPPFSPLLLHAAPDTSLFVEGLGRFICSSLAEMFQNMRRTPSPRPKNCYRVSRGAKTRDCGSDTGNLKYVVTGADKRREALRYGEAAQHRFRFERRRNVSGSTGRIPQAGATRSLHRLRV